MTSESARRRAGLALLVAALIAVSVVSRISGRGTAGMATAVPPIPPPPPGACLSTAGPEPARVPCTALHTAEVLAAWSRTASSAGHLPCRWDHRSGLLDRSGPGWQPPAYSVGYRLLTAGGPVGWVACVQQVIATDVPIGVLSYRGHLLGATSIADYPPELRACYWQTSATAAASPVDCRQPHDAELLAVSNGDPPAGPSCGELAVELVGSAAPFAGPQPLLVSKLNLGATGRVIADIDAHGAYRHTLPFVAAGSHPERELSSCAIRVRPGNWLIGSVVGLGDEPLPYG